MHREVELNKKAIKITVVFMMLLIVCVLLAVFAPEPVGKIILGIFLGVLLIGLCSAMVYTIVMLVLTYLELEE